jgi:dsRNA-specific ribonuclease
MRLRSKSNERLEFLGDGVLELVTKHELYRRFPKADEGFMTEKKISLVKNEHIGSLAYKMQLNKWFIISRNNEEKKGRTNLKKLGCLFEAFIGALFLDFSKETEENFDGIISPAGFRIAQTFILNVYKTHVDWTSLINTDDNFKNILQVKIQKEFKTTPYYVELSERDDDTGYHMGVCLCIGQHIHEVKINNVVHFDKFGSFTEIQNQITLGKKIFVLLGEGKHKVKKKAEQTACELAINKLE